MYTHNFKDFSENGHKFVSFSAKYANTEGELISSDNSRRFLSSNDPYSVCTII